MAHSHSILHPHGRLEEAPGIDLAKLWPLWPTWKGTRRWKISCFSSLYKSVLAIKISNYKKKKFKWVLSSVRTTFFLSSWVSIAYTSWYSSKLISQGLEAYLICSLLSILQPTEYLGCEDIQKYLFTVNIECGCSESHGYINVRQDLGKWGGPVFQHVSKSVENWNLPALNFNNTHNCKV